MYTPLTCKKHSLSTPPTDGVTSMVLCFRFLSYHGRSWCYLLDRNLFQGNQSHSRVRSNYTQFARIPQGLGCKCWCPLRAFSRSDTHVMFLEPVRRISSIQVRF
ncbi:hypothetical protein HS088_TW20G00438 [Tripterygium wilfordii]|uniref:Uncharacterized protein n=1 Tax=Tripterygium wilfordii TaxID=458696 RepID=A0A7J7C7F0_TRIWF|nr:hypothetical protein HS088_TW20G00438 [Tripterygium wilfordii]